MDNVERMFRHLVRVIRTRFPQYMTQPFDVAELHQNILPYRHHRSELGLDTNEDYEITLLELLGGNHGYLVVDDRMRKALQQELTSRNPDPGAFRQFADSQVSLSLSAVEELDKTPSATSKVGKTSDAKAAPRATAAAGAGGGAAPGRPSAASAGGAATGSATRTSGAVASPARAPSAAPKPVNTIVPEQGERCRSCSGELPVGRAITFCPHCGENLTKLNCPACGSELELGWKFCPACGRPAAATR